MRGFVGVNRGAQLDNGGDIGDAGRFELKTLVTVLPPFSRATTATLRLPFWFLAKRRSRRFSL